MQIIRKFFRQLSRFTRDGFKSIYNNLFMSFSSVITLSITLSLCSMFVLFAYNTNGFTRQVENEIKVFVEFTQDVTDEEIESTIEEITAMKHVAKVEHFTKEDGYNDFINRIKQDDPDLAAFFESTSDENPLVDSLVISADVVDNVEEVASKVDDLEAIDFVNYGEESTLSNMMRMTESVRNGLAVVIVVLLVLAVFLIQNTIKLTIYARQQELAIMKLVGASSAHIIVPFLIEGVIIGLVGAFVPILITVYGYQMLYQAMAGRLILPMLQLIVPVPFVYELGYTVVLISVGIALIGSFMAVIKHAVKS